MKMLRVSDAPEGLRAALRERGHTDTDEMTPREAVAEYTGWHIGDKSWAFTILDLYAEAVAASREQ